MEGGPAGGLSGSGEIMAGDEGRGLFGVREEEDCGEETIKEEERAHE